MRAGLQGGRGVEVVRVPGAECDLIRGPYQRSLAALAGVLRREARHELRPADAVAKLGPEPADDEGDAGDASSIED